MISPWGPPKVGRRSRKEGWEKGEGQNFALLALSGQILPFDALFEVFLWEMWSHMKAKPLKLCVWAYSGVIFERAPAACRSMFDLGQFDSRQSRLFRMRPMAD